MVENNFKCSNCGQEFTKWTGKCIKCNEWNTLEEFIPQENIIKKKKIPKLSSFNLSKINVDSTNQERIKTCFTEFNNVVGGGLISDQFFLMGGEPGIGKSTLILQIFLDLAEKGNKVLYISGEESMSQIKDRVLRVHPKFNSNNFTLLSETKLEIISDLIEREKPKFVVIDSIQTTVSLDLQAPSGSISQIRYSADSLMTLCKQKNICVCLIGHVTKDGDLAGPKTLEHIVDTVLNLDGDRYHSLRVLRSNKNRFGPVSEIGLFDLNEKGMKEISDAYTFINDKKPQGSYGFSISCTLEGNKAIIMEIQALTNTTSFGYPKRTASGIKLNKLQLIVAVLEKYTGLKLDTQDIYTNLAGGFSSNEPALDLSVAISIASSYKKTPLLNDLAVIGEIGLSGEIRTVPSIQKQISALKKAGIKKIICPNQEITPSTNIEIIKVKSLKETIGILFP